MIAIDRRSINLFLPFIVAFIYPPLGLIFLMYTIIKFNSTDEDYLSPNFAIFVALLFAVYGYNLYTQSTDLHTYIERVQGINGWTLDMVFNNMFFNSQSKLYVTDFLLYIASKSGNPYLLPCMIGFIDYYIIFYIFLDYRNRCKNKNLLQLILISIMLIGISTPLSVISNVRCVTAYAIICLAAYRELVQKKKNVLTIVLYILPIWIHTSAIMFLMIRLLVYIIKYIGGFSIVIALFLPNVITFLHNLTNGVMSNNVIITSIVNAVDLAYRYLPEGDTTSAMALQYNSDVVNRFVRTYGTFFILLLIAIIYVQGYIHKNNKLKDEKIVQFLIVVAIVALSSLTIPTGIFWRYESAVIFLSPIVLMKTVNDDNKYIRYMTYILLVSGVMAAVVMFSLQKGWVSTSTIINGLVTTNGFEISHSFFNILA